MISIDISNVWGSVEFSDLMAIEQEVAAAHAALDEAQDPYAGHLGWMNAPSQLSEAELCRIEQTAQRIRETSEVFVIVGIGGSYLGAKAAIELLQGEQRNLGRGKKGDPILLYAGTSLSTRQWDSLCDALDGKDFSIAIISRSGATIEPAIAARSLRWMMERKYGTDCTRSRIIAITDPAEGALHRMAQEEHWETFSIPRDMTGRFCVLSAAGLLPMAVAGLDIRRIIAGAKAAAECYALRSYENPVWLYAAIRNLMHRRGKAVELIACCEPDFSAFGIWWQHLFAEGEGKQGRGLLPLPIQLPAQLHTLGQSIQQGQRNLFETVLHFPHPEQRRTIVSDVKNFDGLNYLAGKPLDELCDCALSAAVSAHVDGGVPVITMDCPDLTEETAGELFYFLELSCVISAGISGVNPFNRPGVDEYKENLFRALGKPGFEKTNTV